MARNPDESEEFYVVARILEATAKGEDTKDATERAAVYARAAECTKRGQSAEEVLDTLSEDVEGKSESTVENLRLAAEEIRKDGRAHIVEEVDDAVVARLRSEYD